MSLQVETSKPNVLIPLGFGCISVCMFTSVLVLYAVIYKNGGLTSLWSRGIRQNSNSQKRNSPKNYSTEETVVEMPYSRDELEESVDISSKSEERVMNTPVFSFPWPGRPVEEEGDEDGYNKPRSPPLGVMIPIEPGVIKDKKKNEETYLEMSSSSVNNSSRSSLHSNEAAVNYANCRRVTVFRPRSSSKQQQERQGGQEYEKMNMEHINESIDSVKEGDHGRYDKPKSPPLRVMIHIEPWVIDDTKKKEDTYNAISSSSVNSCSRPSLRSSKAAVIYDNCRQFAVLLTHPFSNQQQEQQRGQEYEAMNLEHIYESIDSVKEGDEVGYDKPRSPPLREMPLIEPDAIEYQKNEETYLLMP